MALVLSPVTKYLPGPRLIDGSQLDDNFTLVGSASGITAVVGGTITTAYQLPYEFAQVDVSTGSNTDAVKLPPAVVGHRVKLFNNSGNTIDVFPNKSTDKINGGSAGAAITHVTANIGDYACFVAGNWQRVIAAVG